MSSPVGCFVAASAVWLLASTAVFAEIYRWTDENGKVHFSDQPTGKQQAEKVEVQTQTPAKPDPEMEAYRQQTREQLRISDEERKAKALEAEKAKPAVSERQCARAKDALRSSLESTAHYDLDKDGNRVYITSEEIEAYRENMRQFIAKNCR